MKHLASLFGQVIMTFICHEAAKPVALAATSFHNFEVNVQCIWIAFQRKQAFKMASIELRSPIIVLLQNLTENKAAAQAEHVSSFNVVCCYN